MHFEARSLKSHSQPVSADDLREESTYFFVGFVDEEMFFPTLDPMVFVGEDLETGDLGQVYFQDLESFRRGARYETVTEDNPATFYTGSRDQLGHVFNYERALEELMACSLRRRKMRSGLVP